MPTANRKMADVMQRRSELLAKISAQREEVAGVGARWQTPLAFADRGLAVLNYLRARPVLVAGAVMLFVIRRHGVVGLLRSGWLVWKGYRYFAAFSERFASRHLSS